MYRTYYTEGLESFMYRTYRTNHTMNYRTNLYIFIFRTHKDYVKALAYAKDREQVASAGLDKVKHLFQGML